MSLRLPKMSSAPTKGLLGVLVAISVNAMKPSDLARVV
jgi:hypothetical protein